MECVICIEPIKTKQYVSQHSTDDIVDSEDPTCLRLACGHAFHVVCITSALRRGFGCPTCREVVEPINQIFDEEINSEEDDDDEWAKNMDMVDNARTVLRTNNLRVKSARQSLNVSLKKYRLLNHELVTKRRKLIRGVVLKFRDSNKHHFEQAILEVQKKLDMVYETEREELEKMGGDIYNFSDSYFKEIKLFEYSAKEILKSEEESPDPLRKKFWRG